MSLAPLLHGAPVAMRVVRDMPMYLLLVCCVYLHHRRDPADPAGGISLRNLRTLYTRRGTRHFAADSHLRDMLAWTRLRGLLRPVASADARVRRLEPTPLMTGMFQHWLRAFVRGGAVALPQGLESQEGLPDADLVHEVLSYRIDGLWVDGYTVVERHPLVGQFMQRRHGYHVFLFLVAGMGPGLDQTLVPLSVSALAERFQVARGTIRNNLAMLAEAGLVAHDGARARAQLLPPFAALARHWMATEITWMNGLCRAAVRQCAPTPCLKP
jgi:DeoR-like helix-turn-helix domain